MQKEVYPVEVIAVPTMYNGELGRSYVALIKQEDGKYTLPVSPLGESETSNEAIERMIPEQVVTADMVDGDSPIHGVGAVGEAYTKPDRMADGRVVGIVHAVQLVDNIKESLEGCTFFRCESEERKVTLSTDDETIILYRDGRVTGDAELLYDHAFMVTAIM